MSAVLSCALLCWLVHWAATCCCFAYWKHHVCLCFGQEKQAAAKHLDLALKTTPWTLTDNYVSRERENKGAQMAYAGPGDPTGKGRGFSFVKDTRKVSLPFQPSLLMFNTQS